MRPKKYPYSGRVKLIRQAMPRLINLGNIAINSELVQYIDFIKKDVRERNRFNSCYYRMWNIQGGMKVDYGSHTHFYYIYWE